MKVLVVGGGGREHAIIWKLKQSIKNPTLYAAPGNGGIASVATCVPYKATDIEGIVEFSKKEAIDLVVVAPDDPLVLGMVDALLKEGIRAFGPSKAAAIIEGSKSFSKNLMKKYNIPTASYETFDSSKAAISYLKEQNSYPAVIKADGLALGKGVIIAQNFEEAEKAVIDIMEDKVFGASGNLVVIEEFLTGQEISVLAFTDGKTLVPMVSAQDHKKIFDGNKGPNTGGMGAFSPSRIYTKDLEKECMEKIFIPTMNAMNSEGRTFKGVLYFGLMMTKKGPMVIEYNARFGDPETQAVLPRLKSDLLEIMEAIVDERLSDVKIEWSSDSAACIVMASGGYPGKYDTGFEIKGISDVADDCTVFLAGVKNEDGVLKTSGGRVLGATCLGENLDEAVEKAYKNVEKISFNNAYFRKDIGKV